MPVFLFVILLVIGAVAMVPTRYVFPWHGGRTRTQWFLLAAPVVGILLWLIGAWVAPVQMSDVWWVVTIASVSVGYSLGRGVEALLHSVAAMRSRPRVRVAVAAVAAIMLVSVFVAAFWPWLRAADSFRFTHLNVPLVLGPLLALGAWLFEQVVEVAHRNRLRAEGRVLDAAVPGMFMDGSAKGRGSGSTFVPRPDPSSDPGREDDECDQDGGSSSGLVAQGS